MIEKVAEQINAMTRTTIIRHPNSMNCLVYGQKILRREPEEYAGIPTMGGMGVMDEDDEVDYEYVYKGDGYALPVDQFSPAPMMDRNDANTGPEDEFRFLIIPRANSGEEDFFELSTHDVVMLLLGMPEDVETCPQLAFEVVGRETTTNVPPFNIRYVCNRRDDLHIKQGGELLHP